MLLVTLCDECFADGKVRHRDDFPRRTGRTIPMIRAIDEDPRKALVFHTEHLAANYRGRYGWLKDQIFGPHAIIKERLRGYTSETLLLDHAVQEFMHDPRFWFVYSQICKPLPVIRHDVAGR